MTTIYQKLIQVFGNQDQVEAIEFFMNGMKAIRLEKFDDFIAHMNKFNDLLKNEDFKTVFKLCFDNNLDKDKIEGLITMFGSDASIRKNQTELMNLLEKFKNDDNSSFDDIVLKGLIEKLKDNLNFGNDFKSNPLIFAIDYDLPTGYIKQLLENGADSNFKYKEYKGVEIPFEQDRTPLYLALMHKNMNVAKLLLDFNANPINKYIDELLYHADYEDEYKKFIFNAQKTFISKKIKNLENLIKIEEMENCKIIDNIINDTELNLNENEKSIQIDHYQKLHEMKLNGLNFEIDGLKEDLEYLVEKENKLFDDSDSDIDSFYKATFDKDDFTDCSDDDDNGKEELKENEEEIILQAVKNSKIEIKLKENKEETPDEKIKRLEMLVEILGIRLSELELTKK